MSGTWAHPVNNAKIAETVGGLVSDGNCVVWIGSGLSVVAEYPTWRELIEDLCTRCKVAPLSDTDAGKAHALIEKAQECKNADDAEYYSVLNDCYSGIKAPTRVALTLLMGLDFRAFITTNFDPLLRLAGHPSGRGFYSYPNLPAAKLDEDPAGMFYIHGQAGEGTPPGSKLVLSAQEFEEAYNGPTSWFLTSLFVSYDIVFVGAELAEPEVGEILRRIGNVYASVRAKHTELPERRRCILLPARYVEEHGARVRNLGKEEGERRRFAEIDIQALHYEYATKDRRELEEILLDAQRLTGGSALDPSFGPGGGLA